MNSHLRHHLIRTFVENLASLDAGELELLGHTLVCFLEHRTDLIHRGLNEERKPVKGTVDTFDDQGTLVAEYGSERTYFNPPFAKIGGDIVHALTHSPRCQQIYLISNRRLVNSNWPKLRDEIMDVLSSQICTSHQDMGGVAGDLNAAEGSDGEHDIEHDGFPRVSVYDDRRIAECLVQLLSEVPDRASSFLALLPIIELTLADFAYEFALPPRPKAFVGRNAEIDIAKGMIERGRVVVISGLSGCGKTDFAKNLAHEVKDAFDSLYWITAAEIRTARQLEAVSVARFGDKANIMARIRRSKTLLILDDADAPFDFTETFINYAHAQSVLIVTSQQRGNDEHTIDLAGLDIDDVRELLAGDPAPAASDLEYILDKTGGLPLILRVLRDTVQSEGVAWSEILTDLDDIGNLPVDHNTIVERVLGRHAATVKRGIAALRFLKAGWIDLTLLRAMAGVSVVRALLARCLVTPGEHGLLRVHQIVLAAVQSNEIVSPEHTQYAEERFWRYIRNHLLVGPYHFTRSLHLHTSIIRERAFHERKPGVAARAYLDLEEAAEQAQLVAELSESEIDVSDWVLASTVIEAMELRARKMADRTDYCCLAAQRLEGELSGTPLVQDVEITLMHHAGKFWLWGKQAARAELYFNKVLQKAPDMLQAHLQLVRTLPDDRKNEAEAHLRYILEMGSEPASAAAESISTLLAGFELLGLSRFESLAEYYLFERPKIFADLVALAASGHFAQPYDAVANVVSKLAYRRPGFAVDLLGQIQLPEPAIDDIRLTTSAARIQLAKYRALTKLDDDAGARECVFRALEYFGRISNLDWRDPDEKRYFAQGLNVVSKHEDALSVLDSIPKGRWNPWVYHEHAKTLLRLNRASDALISIESAIAGLREDLYQKFLATFQDFRGQVLEVLLRLEEAKDAYTVALSRVDSVEFKGDIQRRLNNVLDKQVGGS